MRLCRDLPAELPVAQHPASRAPHLDSSFLLPGTSAPGTPLLGLPITFGVDGHEEEGLEQGKKTSVSHPKDLCPGSPFP